MGSLGVDFSTKASDPALPEIAMAVPANLHHLMRHDRHFAVGRCFTHGDIGQKICRHRHGRAVRPEKLLVRARDQVRIYRNPRIGI